jgi:hypothetical protein
MKKSPPQAALLFLFSLILLFSSCRKEVQEQTKELQEEFITGSPGGGGNTDFCMDPLENDSNYDSLEYTTVLGNQLIGNPYSVAVMQQAAINLYGNSHGIGVNKKYIRFKPDNEIQMDELVDLDIELFDYPLHYDVILEGDYYSDPNAGSNEKPWFYTVVEPSFQPPAGILYEWLGDLHVPAQDIWLEEEALRITGNPTTDTCNSALYRIPPCQNPLDPNCDTTSTGGGGSSSPDLKKPAGIITVWDSNKDQNVPVRRVRVVARRWFKIDVTYTDDLGRYQCTKRFRNKVQIYVKFLNTHLRLSGLFGNFVHRSIWPVKRGIGVYSGTLTRIDYNFIRGESGVKRLYRHWWAAQLMNTYLEFNEFAAAEQIGGLPEKKMKIVLTRLNKASGAGVTTMNTHRLNEGLPSLEWIKFYLSEPLTSFGAYYFNLFANGMLFTMIDMGFGYKAQEPWASNRVKDIMFHEFAHSAHFNKVGAAWWNDLVVAESFTIVGGGVNAPYGDGTDGPHSEIISVGESWAEHVAQLFSNLQYSNFITIKVKQGNLYTNNFPIFGLSSHTNSIEDFSPNRTSDRHRWIPEGIYYDMIDDRNDRNFNPVLPIDNVTGFTNLQLFNALDNDVRSMPQFRTRFLSENGFNQAVVNLFSEYYY